MVFTFKTSTSSVKDAEKAKAASDVSTSNQSLDKKGSRSDEKALKRQASLKRQTSKVRKADSSTSENSEANDKGLEMERPKTPPREVPLDHEDLEMENVESIIINERERSETGLWYPVKGGWIKAGDARWGAPFITGRAEIRQVRNILKFCFYLKIR